MIRDIVRFDFLHDDKAKTKPYSLLFLSTGHAKTKILTYNNNITRSLASANILSGHYTLYIDIFRCTKKINRYISFFFWTKKNIYIYIYVVIYIRSYDNIIKNAHGHYISKRFISANIKLIFIYEVNINVNKVIFTWRYHNLFLVISYIDLCDSYNIISFATNMLDMVDCYLGS